MTAPAAQTPTSEKIAMTAPVTQIKNAGSWIIRFTMPSGNKLETAPESDDPKVQLRRLPPERFAVVRFFKDGLKKSEVDAKSAKLVAAAKVHNLHATRPVSLAQYNPPWTLWFLRRNEVMIPIEP